MHPHTADEHETLFSEHYGIHVRSLVSVFDGGINLPGEVLVGGTLVTPIFPADGHGIVAVKPTLSRILGYEPFRSCRINADLDKPVEDAEIQLELGQGATNLSPWMSGPSWDFNAITGLTLDDPLRQLLDAGVYISLETKLVSGIPRLVVPPPPVVQALGPAVVSAGSGVTPLWPPHVRNDIGFLLLRSDNQTITVTVPAGFALVPGLSMSVGTVGAFDAVKFEVWWCRATSNNMARPEIAQPGAGILAQIFTVRGCIETGDPWESGQAGSTQPTSTTVVDFPSVLLTGVSDLVLHLVAAATDNLQPQVSNWTSPTLRRAQETDLLGMIENLDTFRSTGSGGGFAVAHGYKAVGGVTGSTGGGGATLALASKQVRFAIALKAPPVRSVVANPDDVPWRPFFVGRIDRADPSADEDGVLVLSCRGLYADILDTFIVPPVGKTGIPIDTDSIDELLRGLFALRHVLNVGAVFAVEGEPAMEVPSYFQEPKSLLIAMREAGLQNTWDLRGRFGTAPHGEDVFVLTYYEPDRLGSTAPTVIPPARYYGISQLGKSRDEVRNAIRVTPSDPPRTAVELEDSPSQLKYGWRWMGISEDATSLIATPAQALALAAGILSDTAEPKVGAEIHMRFVPWVEINDRLFLLPNGVHYDTLLEVAVSGYSHTLFADGHGETVLRTRAHPAAANREWRRNEPKKLIVSPDQPTGTAAEGTLWLQRRA